MIARDVISLCKPMLFNSEAESVKVVEFAQSTILAEVTTGTLKAERPAFKVLMPR